MSRYVLRFNGPGEPPAEELTRIGTELDCKVIDASSRMLLVEATAGKLGALAKAFPLWSVDRETFVPVPDARPSLQKNTGDRSA